MAEKATGIKTGNKGDDKKAPAKPTVKAPTKSAAKPKRRAKAV